MTRKELKKLAAGLTLAELLDINRRVLTTEFGAIKSAGILAVTAGEQRVSLPIILRQPDAASSSAPGSA